MWLPYVLVNIMYRGLLVCASFNTISISYTEIFMKLWENALGKHTTTDVRLYIIPLHSILTNDIHFMNILERPLRNPTTTELYKFDDAGEFLYTNFDCFHLVLPLCPKSETYFSSYTGANITDSEVNLRRCQYQTRVTRNRVTFYHPDDHSKSFPPVLHRICLDKYFTWAQKLKIEVEIGNPPTLPPSQQTNDNINVEMERDPSHSPTTTNKYVLYMPTGSATATSDKYTLYTQEKVKKKESELIKDAVRHPIFNKAQRLAKKIRTASKQKLRAEKIATSG